MDSIKDRQMERQTDGQHYHANDDQLKTKQQT